MKSINKLIILLTIVTLYLILDGLSGSLTANIELMVQLLQVYQSFTNLNIQPPELFQVRKKILKY